MRILGLSQLHGHPTISLVEDGRMIAAIAESDLFRQTDACGFPTQALAEIFTRQHLSPDMIDYVAYACFEANTEREFMQQVRRRYEETMRNASTKEIFAAFRKLPKASKLATGSPAAPVGASDRRQYPLHRRMAYSLNSRFRFAGHASRQRALTDWIDKAYQQTVDNERALLDGLRRAGLLEKLVRLDHHLCHAAGAYYASGFDEALLLTLDEYGGENCGGVALGRGGEVERLHTLRSPAGPVEFAEQVAAALGIHAANAPRAMCELASVGDADLLFTPLRNFFEVRDGEILYKFARQSDFFLYLAMRHTKADIAAACLKVLGDIICEYILHFQESTGLRTLVMSGKLALYARVNQRLLDIAGIERLFVEPNPSDENCAIAATLLLHKKTSELSFSPVAFRQRAWGLEFSEQDIENALRSEGLTPEKPQDLIARIADLLTAGALLGHFYGRADYGPNSMGNRAVLVHANSMESQRRVRVQLQRTDALPCVPATLYAERRDCYRDIGMAEHAALFGTVAFACTETMQTQSPAAVYADGTACPMLVSPTSNERLHHILAAYHQLTEIPSILITNLSLSAEPLACSPLDAIRVFKLGALNYLAIGPFLVKGRKMQSNR